VVSSSATHFGTRAFAVAGPKTWNQLSAHSRALETVGPYLYSIQRLLQIVWTRSALVMTFHVTGRYKLSALLLLLYYYYYRWTSENCVNYL